MNALTAWLKSQSASLEATPGATDEVTFTGNKKCRVHVTINSRCSYQTRLAVLLHECGHVAIYRKRRRSPMKRIHGCTFRDWWQGSGRYLRGSRAKKLSILDEELAAWEIGAKLAKRLKVRYSHRAFEKCRVACLMTYVRNV